MNQSDCTEITAQAAQSKAALGKEQTESEKIKSKQVASDEIFL